MNVLSLTCGIDQLHSSRTPKAPTGDVKPGADLPDDLVMRVKSRCALLLLVLVSEVALGLCSGCRMVRAARILRDAQRPTYELTEGVHEDELLVAGIAVRLYRPSDESGPWPALLLCHGAVEAGARDPRLVALARALARHGVLVACPELRSLSSLRADPGDIEHLVDVTRWLEALPERAEERVSMVGISIGGSAEGTEAR